MTSTSTVDYQRTDGGTLRLTFSEPEGALRGGLVVLHEADGVTDGVRLLLASLATEGWLTVTPHLENDRLTQQDLLDATDLTLAWLVERGVQADLLGVMGFDLGGSAALVVASHRKLGAAVSVGGQQAVELPALVEIAGRLTSPWLGMYGDAGDEAGGADVERLRDAAASAKVATNVVHYPGANHRFDADPDAAAEAWQRTLNWFDAHLR
ncbi:carboxymethylenebutenolidase [Amycolatopsis mediterranei S699]|uniref:Carboxymethylenebutenolidase n=2 Tax=Amycolatopsis mediterranei TaxID=33910 RepID=A0A0H3CXP2_AMYMU|nr:dienelactone hydrolase family protein [Amycolatopsis mediterranei]ADJ42096.1 carboxymethylenebutenolidase [Amycolatopsis mediterranei U32]AEK38771.1 carboxymethylenebutenolidase [Amycolatopsis mediterranei S699]AFO73804.1 carboxymethylenebutenolidase [Amycolatopsis mediterranei S699]AGT80933.1 carboxymethylenebutenolidase [Amycolatopsis mediterranei RB]KDO08928.1 carboxymethylenebutenolidase [Amycolatopsis mediterranei]